MNAATQKAVAYIDSRQNPDGTYGTAAPLAETGMALVSYGVLADGTFNNLTATYQKHVRDAITWLLGQQAGNGSWSVLGGDETYATSLALAGLSAFQHENVAIPAAIAAGRAYLVNEFQAPPNAACSTGQTDRTSSYCGGWNYTAEFGRADESNTGFAMFGLQETGGVPAAIQAVNLAWQNNVQADSITNAHYSGNRNDGGASYQPQYVADAGSHFTSNANDTGSMLFGYAYDGAPASDPGVAAGITFGQDILNEYEREQGTLNADSMVFHSGANEDATCTIGVQTCDWHIDPSEGGYHYSLFSLTKGLGSYISPVLADPTNWYAKVVDLLLTQQAGDGSWPQDGRDDLSGIFATELSVATLGLVAVAPGQPTPGEGGCVAKLTAPTKLTVVPGEMSATVSWSPVVSNPPGCIESYVVTPYGSGSPVESMGPWTTTVIYGLTDGASVTFTVAAANGGGVGPQSAKAGPVTIGAPAAVTSLHITQNAKDALKAAFRAPANNGSPVIRYTATCTSTNGGATKTKVGRKSPLTVTGLTTGKTYTCTVRATNSRGTGPPAKSRPVRV